MVSTNIHTIKSTKQRTLLTPVTLTQSCYFSCE